MSIKYNRDLKEFSILRNPAQLKGLLPYYPHCISNLKFTNTPYVQTLPRKKALKHSYIQMNPKSMYVFMVLDIDEDICPYDLWENHDLEVPYF